MRWPSRTNGSGSCSKHFMTIPVELHPPPVPTWSASRAPVAAGPPAGSDFTGAQSRALGRRGSSSLINPEHLMPGFVSETLSFHWLRPGQAARKYHARATLRPARPFEIVDRPVQDSGTAAVPTTPVGLVAVFVSESRCSIALARTESVTPLGTAGRRIADQDVAVFSLCGSHPLLGMLDGLANRHDERRRWSMVSGRRSQYRLK